MPSPWTPPGAVPPASYGAPVPASTAYDAHHAVTNLLDPNAHFHAKDLSGWTTVNAVAYGMSSPVLEADHADLRPQRSGFGPLPARLERAMPLGYAGQPARLSFVWACAEPYPSQQVQFFVTFDPGDGAPFNLVNVLTGASALQLVEHDFVVGAGIPTITFVGAAPAPTIYEEAWLVVATPSALVGEVPNWTAGITSVTPWTEGL